MVSLTMHRYGAPIEFRHASVQEAARAALANVESNEAAPAKIVEDGALVWRNTGPSSYDRLRELAGQSYAVEYHFESLPPHDGSPGTVRLERILVDGEDYFNQPAEQ